MSGRPSRGYYVLCKEKGGEEAQGEDGHLRSRTKEQAKGLENEEPKK